MIIKLAAVGKTDDKLVQSLTETYIKRLNHYNRFEFEVIPDLKKTKNLSTEQQKSLEGKAILEKTNASDYVVLLDENGKQFSSEGFSEYIQKRLNSGRKQLMFLIGGPYGFSEEVYQRADGKLSLSMMTFSHQMIRPFFVEQLYRAFTILKNEPYHHK